MPKGVGYSGKQSKVTKGKSPGGGTSPRGYDPKTTYAPRKGGKPNVVGMYNPPASTGKK